MSNKVTYDLWSSKDLQEYFSLSKSYLNQIIKSLGVSYIRGMKNIRYYDSSILEKISNYLNLNIEDVNTKSEIIIYTPLRIETIYHIYESKMNYMDF